MNFFEATSFFLIYIVLPIAGIATLIYLIMLLKQVTKSVQRLDVVIDDVENKLAILNGPIETVSNIHESYLKFAGIAGSAIIAAQGFVSKKSKKKRKK